MHSELDKQYSKIIWCPRVHLSSSLCLSRFCFFFFHSSNFHFTRSRHMPPLKRKKNQLHGPTPDRNGVGARYKCVEAPLLHHPYTRESTPPLQQTKYSGNTATHRRHLLSACNLAKMASTWFSITGWPRRDLRFNFLLSLFLLWAFWCLFFRFMSSCSCVNLSSLFF